MKKNFKYLILILLLFVCSGCSGNYNLNIKPDLSIEENLELTIENKGDLYQKTLDIFEENDIKRDNYNVNISGDEIIVEYKDTFSSIEDYILNSKVYPQLFNKVEYNKTKKYIDLYTSDNIKSNNEYNKNGTNLTDFDVIQVNINNPYKVNDTDAEMINDNTYTWSIKKDDMNKTIHMQFKPSFNKFPTKSVVVGLLILIISASFIIYVARRYRMDQKI